MGIVTRSLRNVIRNPLRTALITIILTVSIGLALTMATVNGAASNQLSSIGGNIGTEIQVRPAGQFGMMGGSDSLDETAVDKLASISHVVSVQTSAQTIYTGDNLETPAPSDSSSGSTDDAPPPNFNGGQVFRTFVSSIIVMGFDPSITNPTLMGSATLEISEGRYFTLDESDADVVVFGQNLAEANDLTVGSTVDINGTTVEVIGIFSTGQRFGDNMFVMPIDTFQRLFDITGVTSVTVTADDVSNVDGVVSAIREIFDEDTADIVTAESMYERIGGSVTNAGKASQIGMFAAFGVAAVVILFSVALMVRQRVKEIGILKAIGASGWHIGLQFSIETLVISLAASIIGALITFPLANSVAKLLSGSSNTMMAGGGRAMEFFGGGITRIAGINVAVSPEIFLYALATAIVLSIIASIIPAWYIGHVKPAEVFRYE
ncbi:MAG: ABC transporter permease [Dehalococcoidales bacterium]|nr:ABC transporter permease [Dehalococcoidales bacterium]